MEITPGQWFGSFTSSKLPEYSGFCTLTIEDPASKKASLATVQKNFPRTILQIDFLVENEKFIGKSFGTPIVFGDHKNSSSIFLENFIFEGSFIDTEYLTGTWHFNDENFGEFRLRNFRNAPAGPLNYTPWHEFKGKFMNVQNLSLIFRGQINSQWTMRTSFNRSGRFDLQKYHEVDLPAIHKVLESFYGTTLMYDKFEYSELLGVLSFAQHHKYPTPLLDWTENPLIAAFFAINQMDTSNQNDSARIFVLNRQMWEKKVYQARYLYDPSPSLSTIRCMRKFNPRHTPQESIHMLVNLDAIEPLIHYFSEEYSIPFLEYYDIKYSEIDLVRNDLEQKGITSDFVFPSIDSELINLKLKMFR